MKILDKNFQTLIKRKYIERDIKQVAKQINKDYKGKQDIVLLCVLNGAMMFTSQLMKDLNIECELATIKLKSYNGTERENLHIVSPLTTDIKNKHVIICEDIVDSGATIDFLTVYLEQLGTLSVRTATMLYKPKADKVNDYINPEYVVCEIGNEFIAGYGLDYNEYGRNCKNIVVLDKS